MTDFFVPHALPEETEKVYGRLAGLCGATVPSMDRRVHRIRWTHDGEEWLATVGEPLRGTRTRRRRRGGQLVDVSTRLSDPAIVLAIFPGDPFWVVTNARPVGRVTSYWANPFMAGRPSSVVHFDATPP